MKRIAVLCSLTVMIAFASLSAQAQPYHHHYYHHHYYHHRAVIIRR